MLNVIDSHRLLTVTLMLLSQLAGGMAVMCDEGLGGQIMELFPQFCCETDVGSDAGTPLSESGGDGHMGLNQDLDQDMEVEQDPCGPCLDIPLVSFLPTDEDLTASVQLPLLFVATLPDTPLAQLLGSGATARDLGLQVASPSTVARLAGTVVLLC